MPRRPRPLGSVLLALLAAALLPACAHLPGGGDGAPDRASGIERILREGELRVGMSGDQPPLNMTTKDGQLIGLEVALARALAENMGVEARFVTKPFPELLPALEAGEVDMVMSGLTITPKRNLRAAFVGPYFVSGKSVLTHPHTLEAVRRPADLNAPSFRVAALRGSTSAQFVERVLPDATLVTVDALDAGVAAVVSEEVDALIADYETCALAALRRPEEDLVYLRRPFTVEPIGIALPAEDPLLVNLIGNYLAA
ncbi:MAG: transporter substrate-binding domain-containing protein, partial [Myxococcota bacterium]|nr:transporter substrate-binding domain-containing protein [Myxococcota bacterium]